VKRFLILLVVIATCLVAGCVGQVETYTDPGQTIDIGVNQEFVIALGSNLELVEKIYKEAKQGVVGAGGVEYFRFKALETGRTEITLVYKRPWEEPTPQDITKVFTINIRYRFIYY